MEKEVQDWFQKDRKNLSIEEKRKTETFLFLEKEIKKKQIIPRASASEIMRTQIRFMSKKMILLQMIVFVVIVGIYGKVGSLLAPADIYSLAAVSASLFSALLVIACFEEEKFNIGELTGSCYFNHKQICGLKMVLHGGMNLIMLSIITVYTGSITRSRLIQVGIYIFVPYLLAGCIHLWILLVTRGKNAVITVGLCGVMVVMCSSLSTMFPRLYEEAAMGFWFLCLVLFAVFYGGEIVSILRQVDRGERLCMN